MSERIETPEIDPREGSALAEWIASLTIVVASAAFALLLAGGPKPAMDRARIDPPPGSSECTTGASCVAAAVLSSVGG